MKGQGSHERPALVTIPVGGPFECIGMDFVEFDRSHSGNRYTLVIQDYLTKWPEVNALPDSKAEIVAKCLLDLTWRHGVPSRIIHDRAVEFLAHVSAGNGYVTGSNSGTNLWEPPPNRWLSGAVQPHT